MTYTHCQESNDVGVLYNPQRKSLTPNLVSEIYFLLLVEMKIFMKAFQLVSCRNEVGINSHLNPVKSCYFQ